MSDIIDVSDDDDCILECVVDSNKSNENHSELYYEVSKTNQHLADFIDKCINLENTKMMLKILKGDLLNEYYQLEKSVRESPKVQKAIRRANNLLNASPRLKYTHIKDLSEILKASKVKKKVPFITLTTNLADKNNAETSLKRCNSTNINGTSCKKPKLDTNHLASDITPQLTEAPIILSMNDTADILDESTVLANSSQESITTDENIFLVPKASVSVDSHPASNEERIKKLERRLAYYQKEIARLDELEVDDDSINSPYIKSERLKSAIVVIYEELCQLMGSQPVKRKEIRLRVVAGHPPGPTKILETYLNNNIGSDGHPPFPDFCDVVNCVVEANKMDDLGWTKCQIMKEAGMLFTQCGRALQKRRQIREYRDLLWKVKEEECLRDPAEDDPELLARLEENKRIAIKKESVILERFTMMESLPTKPKVQKNGATIKNIGNEVINESTTTDEIFNHNNNSIINVKHNVEDECKNSKDTTCTDANDNPNINDHKNSDENKKSMGVTSQDSKTSVEENAIQGASKHTNEENKEGKQKALEISDNANKENEGMNFVHSNPNDKVDKLESNCSNPDDKGNKLESNCSNEITNTEVTDTGDQCDNHSNKIRLKASNYVTGDSSIESKSAGENDNLKENDNDFLTMTIKREPEEELSSLLESIGEDFTLIIENIEHPTVIIEISDSSEDELE